VNPKQLAKLVDRADVARVLDAFAALDVGARRKIGPVVAELVATRGFEPDPPRWNRDAKDGKAAAALAALYATWDLRDVRKHALAGIHPVLAEVLDRLRPAWASEVGAILIEASAYHYVLVRSLVRRGLCAPPASDNYAIGFIGSNGREVDGEVSLVARLRKDDQARSHEVWHALSIEGTIEGSFVRSDQGAERWSDAFAVLAAEGLLSRDRLLDATLAALARDYLRPRAQWFSGFIAELKPTVAEQAARSAAYVRLLGSTLPPTVTVAVRALVAIEREVPLPIDDVLPPLENVLVSRTKSAVQGALALLTRFAERAPESREAVTRTAAAALIQEKADLQGLVFDLLDVHGDASSAGLRDRIEAHASGVAPTLRGRLARYRGDGASAASAAKSRTKKPSRGGAVSTQPAIAQSSIGEAPSARAARGPSQSLDPLDDSRRLVPIANLDTLLERIAHLLEDHGDPDEVELVLDGLGRLAAERPADFTARIGPVRKRAEKLLARRYPERFTSAIAGAVLAWGGGKAEPPPKWAVYGAFALLTARAATLGDELRAKRRVASLAAPTHRGGWIDPVVLVERFAASPDVGARTLDVVCALLRLAPSRRDVALAAAAKLRGEAADALRHALGHPLGGKAKIGPTAALWLAAARARSPREDDLAVAAAFPDAGPDGGLAARFEARMKGAKPPYLEIVRNPPMQAAPPLEHAAVTFHPRPKEAGACGLDKSLVRWAATIWPGGSETFFADALPTLFSNRVWHTAYWMLAAYYERLLDPTLVFGPMALLTLAVGLLAKDPNEVLLSTDAALRGLGDGRIDPRALGDAMALLRSKGDITMARWAKNLGTVAAESESHRHAVVVAMQASLRGSVETSPRDEGAFVELLRELCTDLGARITDPDAWAYLAASRHAKKVKDLAPG
jgi:hypothetical protein